MATEIVTLKVNDKFSTEACESSLEFLNPPPPGLQTFRWGRTVEDPNTVMWILNWDTVASHEAFIKSPIYPTFVGTINAFCSAPIAFYHTHVLPFPPTKLFEAGIIEIAEAAKKPNAPYDEFVAACTKPLELFPQAPGYHSHFHGLKHEDPNVFILLCGWDSVESHVAFSESQGGKGARAAAGGVVVWEKSFVCHLKLHRQ